MANEQEFTEDGKESSEEVRAELGMSEKDDYSEPFVMPEEKKVDNIELSDKPKYSDIENEALGMGWTPKDQFQGDQSRWVNAKEFVGRKPIYDQIQKERKNSRKFENQLKGLTDLLKKQTERTLQKDEQSIVNQRRSAIESGDVEAVNSFDEQMQQISKQKEEIINLGNESSNANDSYDVKQVEYIDPATIDFSERHKNWLVKKDGTGAPMTAQNMAMTTYVQILDSQLSTQHPTWTAPQILSEIERNLKKQYPQHFGVQQYNSTNVESNSGVRSMQQKKDIAKWTQDYTDKIVESGAVYRSRNN